MPGYGDSIISLQFFRTKKQVSQDNGSPFGVETGHLWVAETLWIGPMVVGVSGTIRFWTIGCHGKKECSFRRALEIWFLHRERDSSE